MKKGILYTFFFLMIVAALIMMDRGLMMFQKAPAWPVKYKDYVVTTNQQGLAGPELKPIPDLSVYTMANLMAKIPPLQAGKVSSRIMKDDPGFDKFTEIRRQVEFSRLQGRDQPVAILVEKGVYDLSAVVDAIGDKTLISLEPNGVFLLRVPLYISPDAVLVIKGADDKSLTLRMSSVSGAFLVNAGKLFVVNSRIEGWDDKEDQPALYSGKSEKFRPFITTWSGSETYFGRSSFYDLGYAASKSYGISFSVSSAFLKKNPSISKPSGWLIDSHFERLFYGFYCYEAADVAIVNNVYVDNIVYGIDPHDRSDRLLIAGNDVSKTREKHGIIGSREVNDSWIVNNRSYANKGSGFMLDRSSVRNLISGNVAYDNGSDGITLFESQDNVIVHNRSYRNGKNGLRLRNSWNVKASDNLLVFNKGVGLQVYAQDITKDEKDRDFELDPFTQKSGIDFADSVIFGNSAGAFKFNDTDYVRLSNIKFGLYDNKFVRGQLDDMSPDIAYGLIRLKNVEIQKVISP